MGLRMELGNPVFEGFLHNNLVREPKNPVSKHFPEENRRLGGVSGWYSSSRNVGQSSCSTLEALPYSEGVISQEERGKLQCPRDHQSAGKAMLWVAPLGKDPRQTCWKSGPEMSTTNCEPIATSSLESLT